jgi:segregation and condensation protein A
MNATHTITLEKNQFEGPLDLLLTLIEGQQLNITDIALAQVTEQFLQYVRKLEELDPTSLSDFLAIAAKLLVIKSKAILPTLEIEQDEDDAGVPLETQLVLYKQFREIAKYLKNLDAQREQSFTRSLVFSQRVSFFPDPGVQTPHLHAAVLKVLNELKELDNLPKARIKEAISIQEKITQLQGLLSKEIETKLSSVLAKAKNKSEVIVTFLALLELIKQRIFSVEQDALFTDITIRKLEHTPTHEPPHN